MPKLVNYPCRYCKADLVAMDWNDRCWLLVCKDIKCSKVHTPQGNIIKESEKEAELMLRHGLPMLKGGVDGNQKKTS